MSQIVEPWNHISCPGIHLEREIAEAREISLKERPKWMINVGENLNNNHDNEKDIWRKKIQWSLMCHSLMFWTLLNTISKKKIWICVHLFLHLKVSSNEALILPICLQQSGAYLYILIPPNHSYKPVELPWNSNQAKINFTTILSVPEILVDNISQRWMCFNSFRTLPLLGNIVGQHVSADISKARVDRLIKVKNINVWRNIL